MAASHHGSESSRSIATISVAEEPVPFVEGWEFTQTLGEGAYGEVKLAVCHETMECVAVKIIHVTDKAVFDTVKKEICILKMLDHKNVIKFFGHRRAEKVQYLFLKYAQGGELFDRIEPDVGVSVRIALRYFRDLIEGVEYLHSRGVCHRDLKPENLLFDEDGNLQITDFGLATVFRYQGQERELSRMCGTKPYTAPEVLRGRPYRAEPADVWSCGIILVALLAGELPWDIPSPRDPLYRNWKECHITTSPWNKIDTLALSLCRSVLTENTQKRYTIAKIKKHQFYNKKFPLKADENASPSSPQSGSVKRRRVSNGDEFSTMGSPQDMISASQPERSSNENCLSPLEDTRHCFSFSQPTHVDNMFLNSQMQSTPGTSQTQYQKLVKRMTRFFVTTPKAQTIKELTGVLDAQGYGVKKSAAALKKESEQLQARINKLSKQSALPKSGLPKNTGGDSFSVEKKYYYDYEVALASEVGMWQLTCSTTDKRQAKLIFKICLMDMGGYLLVDFRLSKGDGLEFKRNFVCIRNKLRHIIRKAPPLWPSVIPEHATDEEPSSSSRTSASDLDTSREEPPSKKRNVGSKETETAERKSKDEKSQKSKVSKDSSKPSSGKVKEEKKQDSKGEKVVRRKEKDREEDEDNDGGVRYAREAVQRFKRSTSI